MFWKKKKGKDGGDSANPGKPSREEIIAKAKASMASARAEIGDETLDKIKEAMMKKQASAIERAKAQIKAADADKVRDNIQFLLREDRPPKK
jgi:ElaB/YqjD/DUF883 family membrane-anchored ribosome-binding protein